MLYWYWKIYKNIKSIVEIFYVLYSTNMLFNRSEETQLVSSLANILGNKPNLTVIIESIKAMSDDKSQVLFFVQEKGANGEFPFVYFNQISVLN